MENNELLSIGQLAQMSGCTSRTLRHYQQIGLLLPIKTKPDGERFFGSDQVLRLQHILVLKQTGMPLEKIAKVLDSNLSKTAALAEQGARLDLEIKRLQNMKEAVELTLLRIENKENLVMTESFDGFEQNPYAYEAEQRWPDNFAESQKRMGKLSPQQRGDVIEVGNEITRQLAALFKSEAAADSPEVQEQIDRHYNWVCNFWTPQRESYIGLGEMYVADARFTAHYNEFAVGLAPFIRDAILRYAASNLV
jgi:DNA-binding transcriptional MerR regulator